MAKTKSKQVYMNEPLIALESTMKENGGSFSARLGEIVERYQMMLDLETLPEFSRNTSRCFVHGNMNKGGAQCSERDVCRDDSRAATQID